MNFQKSEDKFYQTKSQTNKVNSQCFVEVLNSESRFEPVKFRMKQSWLRSLHLYLASSSIVLVSCMDLFCLPKRAF